MANKRSFLRRMADFVIRRGVPAPCPAGGSDPRPLGVEQSEPPPLLTNGLVWAPFPAQESTTNQGVGDWTDKGAPVFWDNGDAADIPARSRDISHFFPWETGDFPSCPSEEI